MLLLMLIQMLVEENLSQQYKTLKKLQKPYSYCVGNFYKLLMGSFVTLAPLVMVNMVLVSNE